MENRKHPAIWCHAAQKMHLNNTFKCPIHKLSMFYSCCLRRLKGTLQHIINIVKKTNKKTSPICSKCPVNMRAIQHAVINVYIFKQESQALVAFSFAMLSQLCSKWARQVMAHFMNREEQPQRSCCAGTVVTSTSFTLCNSKLAQCKLQPFLHAFSFSFHPCFSSPSSSVFFVVCFLFISIVVHFLHLSCLPPFLPPHLRR